MICEGEQPHAHTAHGDDRRGIAKEWLPGCRDDGVGRAHGKTDNVLELPGAIRRVLVVVIAEGHEVVAQGIHHRERGGAAREVRQQLIAERVAGVKKHHGAGWPSGADLPDCRGEPREPANDAGAWILLVGAPGIARLGRGGAGVHHELTKVAVDVVRMDNRE